MNETVRVFLTRLSMIFFWLLILASCLYAPVLVRMLSCRNSITVFAWPLEIDPKVLTQFEVETGIHVYVSYYESNIELYSKLRSTNGKGYDLIIPSHYVVPRLLKHGYLKKLDKDKLSFYDQIRPELKGHFYDPDDAYTIPYFWGILGIGIDAERVFDGAVTWENVFNPSKMNGMIGMTDDPYEAIFMAARYLFHPIPENLAPDQIKAIKHMLAQQKPYVESYSDTRAGELLASHTCRYAVGLSTDILRFNRQYPSVGFRVPREGGILLIDTMVIPAATSKDDLVYAFINFLYRQDIIAHHVHKYATCSAMKTIPEGTEAGSCVIEEALKNALLVREVMPRSELNDIWISLMAQ